VTRSIDLVVNPRAGAGRAGRALGDMVRALADVGFDVEVHVTERPGHAGEIVRRLVRGGRGTIGVMGGDGSFYEALAGLRDEDGARMACEEVTLAVVPAGTGGDLRKTLGIPDGPRAIARYLADATPRPFDLGEIAFVRHDGGRETRYFGNIASFGLGGVVDQVVNQGPKWLGGRVAFFVGSMRAQLAYTNVPVRVFVDDEPFYEGPMLNVAVANGRAFGGGMFVAPDADPHDGLFDVVVMGDLSRVEATALLPDLYRGRHLGHRKIHHCRGRVVRAEKATWRDALLDIDGETPGKIDATFTVVPGAIRMLERV
jgi:YegS/Rv2252/BmrU family lipid kinase